MHFNPLSPHGERHPHRPHKGSDGDFNPLSPHGERPRPSGTGGRCIVFQSTLPTRGETAVRGAFPVLHHISIHSPHTGRDGQRRYIRGRGAISIHSPHTGRDVKGPSVSNWESDFNPLSPHGERRSSVRLSATTTDFNPLSPHGERPGSLRRNRWRRNFNPLSPHGERPHNPPAPIWTCNFNPLSPHGERRRSPL